jgi:hypothetical protein
MLPKVAAVIIKYLKPVSVENEARSQARLPEGQAEARSGGSGGQGPGQRDPEGKKEPSEADSIPDLRLVVDNTPPHPRPSPSALFGGFAQMLQKVFAKKSYDSSSKKPAQGQKEGKGSFIDKKII